MPTSRGNHISYLIDRILDLKPKSILDVGVGFGSKGMLFREYTDIWNGRYKKDKWTTKIDGIEIFKDYINDIQLNIYDTIHNGNALDILPTLDKYDLIYAGDILEHFTIEDGNKFIELLKQKGKTIIISTPKNVLVQGESFGNKHEEHKSQWLPNDFEGAELKQFGNVMIIEYNIQLQKHYCPGMSFYGDKIPLIKYKNKHNPLFFLGFYFEDDYKVFQAHKSKKIVFWNGSDVQRLLNNKNWIKIMQDTEAEHYCHNTQLQGELNSIGIKSEIIPLFFGYKKNYNISFKPSEVTKVFINAHPGREIEYGLDIVKEIAQQLLDIEFHIYGVDGLGYKNITYHGQIPEAKMDEEIKNYQGCLRLNEHDGLSQVVIKSHLLGLYIYTIRDKEELINQLTDLKNKKEPCIINTDYIKDLNWIKGLKI